MAWDSYIGSGAELGAGIGSVIPGFGTVLGGAIGAGVGLLSGLFGGHNDTPHWNDPYAAQRQSLIAQLSNSNLGQQQAALAAAQGRHFADDQIERVNNNPNFASNASALSGITNNIQREQERGAASAYLQGAQIDQGAKERAAQLSLSGSQLSQGGFQMNQAYADRPTFGESLSRDALSTASGYGLSQLLGNKKTTDTTEKSQPYFNSDLFSKGFGQNYGHASNSYNANSGSGFSLGGSNNPLTFGNPDTSPFTHDRPGGMMSIYNNY